MARGDGLGRKLEAGVNGGRLGAEGVFCDRATSNPAGATPAAQLCSLYDRYLSNLAPVATSPRTSIKRGGRMGAEELRRFETHMLGDRKLATETTENRMTAGRSF